MPINATITPTLSASGILSKLLGVDGAGSGLDSDLLDGQHGSYYLALGNATGILAASLGGTGVSNAGTITNANNTTITGGGTLALGGFTFTIPATGTAGLLGTAQTWTAANTFSDLLTANDSIVFTTSGSTGTRKWQGNVLSSTTDLLSGSTTANYIRLRNSSSTSLLNFGAAASNEFRVLDSTAATTYLVANATSVTVPQMTASTSPTTGALIVANGLGVGGAANIGSSVTATNFIVNTNGSGIRNSNVTSPGTIDGIGIFNTSALYFGIKSSADYRWYIDTTQTMSLTSSTLTVNAQIDNTSTSGITTRRASTQDAVRLLGRAGGTSTRIATITCASLSASQTYTLPDATGTLSLINLAETFSAVKTFTAAPIFTTPTASLASWNEPAGTSPTTPSDGMRWATIKGQYAHINGNTVSPTYGRWSFSDYTESQQVVNTTTPTDLLPTGVGNKTLPANTLQQGTVLEFYACGTISTAAAGATGVQLDVVLGGLTADLYFSGLSNNSEYRYDLTFRVVVEGSGASVGASGYASCIFQDTAGAFGDIKLLSTREGTTINTTTTKATSLTVTWDAASVDNYVTLIHSYLKSTQTLKLRARMQPYSLIVNADNDGVFAEVIFHACQQITDPITDEVRKGHPVIIPIPNGARNQILALCNNLADKAATAQLVQAERQRRQEAGARP